jgi:hypothetical protein
MTIKRISFFSILFLCMLFVVLILSIIVSQQKQNIQEHAQTQQATFTFVNNTNQTIWVGAQGSTIPNNGGWELPAHASMDVSVPSDWASGRFWGRTGCKFDSQGNGTCETGDCGGRLQCNGAGGVPPVSLAEFTLDGAGGRDFYDVSLVDGSNLPMFINTVNSAEPDPITADGCINRPASEGPSGCMSDINAICPADLQVKNALGEVVACKSACAAFGTDQYCCQGAYGTPNTCNHTAWPVDYAYNIFKKAQPYAYSYAFDDSSSTFTCPHCNYRITFGLPSSNAQPSVNPSTPAVTPKPTIILTPTPTPLIPTFNCLGLGRINCLGSSINPTAVNSPVISSTQPNTISSTPNPTQPNRNLLQLLAPGILIIIILLGAYYYYSKRSS